MNSGIFAKHSINYHRLYSIARANHQNYISGQPFPHIQIDDFFSAEIFSNICNTFPSVDSDIWKTPSNRNTLNKSVTKQGELSLKESLFDEGQRRVFMELNSSLFIKFVEILTGIDGLMPDPYLAEASYAMSGKGGTLNIHADFSHHDKLKLERRVNVLIYLNEAWEEEWLGALGLYDEDLNLINKIFPVYNRVAVFSTSPKSFHGFPEPIACPDDVKRKSINMYYYTVPRAEREVKKILFPTDPLFVPTVTKD